MTKVTLLPGRQMQQAVIPTSAPSPARRPTPSHRRRSGSFNLRNPVRRSCRNCHEVLADPLGRCWMCGTRIAGVRWGRLLLRVAIVGLAAAAAVTFLR